ncbi:hypothetical protein [Streptomyces sp. LS1784]|uniref:hypothetical protein n=1 Tax=Streptomyces sp. LS1784 TaxID=2851533 RepID=UPI001CCA62B7|nr:hypothetical protein [Streptomyces sp. LS1784]
MDEPVEQWEELCGRVQSLNDQIERLGAAQDRHIGDLGNHLGEARTGIARLERELRELSVSLSHARTAIGSVSEKADVTHGALTDFVARYGRDQIVTNARAELSRLTTEWQARFSHRRQVRALARGLVHALTESGVARGLVSIDTIEACTQEQLLLEPSFWLAPAVVAVAAGYSNDTARADRARSHALNLDRAKATLFFALTCSRRKQQSEAARWMDRYLSSLDPFDLGQEFTVVLDAVAGAELGFDALTYARQAMVRWDREANARLFTMSHADRALMHLTRWRPWMSEKGVGDSGKFKTLEDLCGTQWATIQGGWHSARVVKGTFDYLRDEYSADPLAAEGGQRTDVALGHLIAQLDPDEDQMHRQMERLRTIIRHEGDSSAAASDFPDPEDREPSDFHSILERAIFEPESGNLGYPARLLILQSLWPNLRSAAAALSEQSETVLSERLTLTVDDWSCELPPAPIRPEARQQLIGELRQHLMRNTDEAVDAVAPLWPRILAFFIAAVVFGGLALLVGGPAAGLGTVVSVLTLIAGTWGVASVPLRRRRLREDGSRHQAASTAKLEGALKQHSQLLRQWSADLATADQLSTWSPATGDLSTPQHED